MPYLVMKRTDIPDGVLQVVDLKPNDSQRNYIYDPPGQTGYIRNRGTQSTVATTGAGPIVTNATYTGLAAYLIDRVENQAANQALSAAIVNATQVLLLARIAAGSTITAANVAADLVTAGAGGGTSLTAGNSTGSLLDILAIAAGATYSLPGGVQVETAGNAFVPAIKGSFTARVKTLYLTGEFQVSNAVGNISLMKGSSFVYKGITSPAIVVYSDTGTVL